MATCKYCAATIANNSEFCKKCGKENPIFTAEDAENFGEKNVNEVKWYNNTFKVILFLILLFPIGLYGTYKNEKWASKTKVRIYIFWTALVIIAVINKLIKDGQL